MRPRDIIAEADKRKSENPSFGYGVHPVRCNCGLFLYHDGRRLGFKDRIIYSSWGVVSPGSKGE